MERTTRLLLSIILLLLRYYCCMASLTIAEHTKNLTTDQSALLALKSHITSDPHNMIYTNWSTKTSVCNWVGVTCAARHPRVAALNLSFMGLTGTLPPELGNLSFLVEFQIRNNSFHGALPKELAHFRRLKVINFGFNDFIGSIPSWFGSLSKLRIFFMYGNQFSGSLPNDIFNISTLQVIDLRYNQLSGRIPREIGNSTMLKEIYLDMNSFKEIPNEIGALDQLELLTVQKNALKGHVPVSIFNMSSLTILALFGNNLIGSLPDNICQHLPSLQRLLLSSNQFDGPVPSKLWQCKELSDLGLDNNNFIGNIPKSIGNATQLTDIYLSLNHLTGTVPYEIGNLPNLEGLSLDSNNFSGQIPSSIFNMSTIGLMSFSQNQFSGSLSSNIGSRHPNLEVFHASTNMLDGVIPKSISNASKLTELYLGNNLFSGYIPSTLCALYLLQSLQLGLNNLKIDTSTPEVNFLYCMSNLKNLELLSLLDNPLNALLPVSVANLSSVHKFYFSYCNISGNIPNDVGNLSSLRDLNLGYNKLGGSIPTTMGRLQNLQGLYLDHNKLQGNIPYELCHLQNLVDLSLYGNQLSGSIPSCLSNLVVALRSLLLGSNLLNSTIPATLWGLAYLLHLDLSSNSLTGPLSEYVGNLKVVIDADFSSNYLSGTIPRSIGGLEDLFNLSLSNNNFEGSIPTSFGNFPSLEFLDLSKNNLSGVIPKSLEALSHLKYLNLSFNRLQGEIPTGGPFQNFSAQSFISNGELCGAPRLHVPLCKRKAEKSNLKYIIPGVLSAVLLVTFIWMLILRSKRSPEAATQTTWLPSLLWRKVSYLELQRATNGFHQSNLLGIGGFGSVYKGTLADGIDVAIKVFNLDTEGAFTSFDMECEMLSNIRHRNLIKVISCCSQIDFKALILNYMPNGSLDHWLYSQNFSLNILQRLTILIDVASALEYLHHGYETPIVHCDLKPSNILLDDDMVAHVADFGIAKLLGGDSITHTMTLATIGYMAPEYGMEGRVSRRGDVYTFGILVMETFTKKKPTDEMFGGNMSLKQWVANALSADTLLDVLDETLLGAEEGQVFVSKMICLSSSLRLALACSAESPEERINMQEVLATLKKIKISLLKEAAEGVLPNRPGVLQTLN